jgi:hypothetical protein
VEKVNSFKFLCIHIMDKLKWSNHSVVKKAHHRGQTTCHPGHRLFNLSRLKKCGLSPKTLTNFYRCTIESILSHCITTCYGICTANNRRALQRVVRSAQRITGVKLPAVQDTYSSRYHRKAKKIIKDNNHPRHYLLTPLPSRRQKLFFNLKVITLLNSRH